MGEKHTISRTHDREELDNILVNLEARRVLAQQKLEENVAAGKLIKNNRGLYRANRNISKRLGNELRGLKVLRRIATKNRNTANIAISSGKTISEIRSQEGKQDATDRSDAKKRIERSSEGISQKEFNVQQRETFLARGQSRDPTVEESVKAQARIEVIKRGQVTTNEGRPVGVVNGLAFSVAGKPEKGFQQRITENRARNNAPSITDINDGGEEQPSPTLTGFNNVFTPEQKPQKNKIATFLEEHTPLSFSGDIVEPSFPSGSEPVFSDRVETKKGEVVRKAILGTSIVAAAPFIAPALGGGAFAFGVAGTVAAGGVAVGTTDLIIQQTRVQTVVPESKLTSIRLVAQQEANQAVFNPSIGDGSFDFGTGISTNSKRGSTVGQIQAFGNIGSEYAEAYRGSTGRQLSDLRIDGKPLTAVQFQSAQASLERERGIRGGGKAGVLLATAPFTELGASMFIGRTVGRATGNFLERGSSGAVRIGLRTGGFGAIETATISASSSFIDTDKIDALQTAKAGGFGFLAAGSAGAGIGFFSAIGGKIGRSGAKGTNIALNVFDPAEAVGDFVADRVVAKSGRKLPSIRVKGRTAIFGNSFVSNPTTSPIFSSTPSPNRSSQKRSNPTRVFNPTFTRSPTFTRTPTRTFTSTFTRSPSKTQTPTKTLTPNKTFIPTRTQTPTKTFTKLPVVTSGFPLPVPFGFGKKSSRKKSKGKSKGNKRGRFAPSLAATQSGITAKKGIIPKGGFTGLEIRPIIRGGGL